MLIGVDWGGTKIETIALSAAGEQRARLREATLRGDYEGCVRMIAGQVARIEAETGERGSVGVGIPGSIAPESGRAKGANSTWLIGRPVQRDLEAELGRSVRVENDANCLALSEATDGAGVGYQVVFAVILGTGSGAGITIDGRVHTGPNTAAGEWAHNPLPTPAINEIPGPACYCGKHGCLESFISGTGFENDYARHATAPAEGREIMARVRAGDWLAGIVWRRYVERLARGLALVVNILDPDIFVLGGGMSDIEGLGESVAAELPRHVFSNGFRTPIRRAKHGASSGVRGAAWLWRKEGPGAGR